MRGQYSGHVICLVQSEPRHDVGHVVQDAGQGVGVCPIELGHPLCQADQGTQGAQEAVQQHAVTKPVLYPLYTRTVVTLGFLTPRSGPRAPSASLRSRCNKTGLIWLHSTRVQSPEALPQQGQVGGHVQCLLGLRLPHPRYRPQTLLRFCMLYEAAPGPSLP